MAERARRPIRHVGGFAAAVPVTIVIALAAVSGFAAATGQVSIRGNSASEPPVVAAHVASGFLGASGTLPSISVSAGDAVYVFVAGNGSAVVSSVTDTSSDSYVQEAIGSKASVLSEAVFEADDVGAAPSLAITVTLSAAEPFAVAVTAVAGVPAHPDDSIGAKSTGAQGPGAPGRVTTSVADDLILEAVAEGAAQPVSGDYDNTGATLENSSTAGTAPGDVTIGSLSELDSAVGAFTIYASIAKWAYYVTFAVAVKAGPPAVLPTYSVSFDEQGLPVATNWSVTLAGSAVTVPAPDPVVFSESNGTYPFSVAGVPGFSASSSSGSVTVSGSNTTGANVTFTALHPSTGGYIQHVVVIMLENQGLSEVWSQAPYEEYLAKNYGNATSFYAACHRSPPNYMAMTGGSVSDSCYPAGVHRSTGENIGDLFQSAGLTWAEYAESMPTPCDQTSTAEYGKDHSPFIYYTDVVNNASRCDAHVVNSAMFNSSLAAGTLDNYSLYIPNEYDDGHTPWSVVDADTWLRGFLTPILNHTGSYASAATQNAVNHTAIFILYDEAPDESPAGYETDGIVLPACQADYNESYSVCGGRVDMFVVSPYSLGRSWTENATDYNVESTIEWLFSLPSDGGYDGTAAFPAMTGLFSFSSNDFSSGHTS